MQQLLRSSTHTFVKSHVEPTEAYDAFVKGAHVNYGIV